MALGRGKQQLLLLLGESERAEGGEDVRSGAEQRWCGVVLGDLSLRRKDPNLNCGSGSGLGTGGCLLRAGCLTTHDRKGTRRGTSREEMFGVEYWNFKMVSGTGVKKTTNKYELQLIKTSAIF